MNDLASKVSGKTIVDILLHSDANWQDKLEDMIDQYGTDNALEVEIGGCIYKVKIMPDDNPVAVRLIYVPKVMQSGSDAHWKKAEKSSITAEQRRQQWLAYLKEKGLPLHDPSKEIVEKPPFSIMGDLPVEE